MIAGVYSLVDD